jgi:membrane-associated protease RseP (regulator of RpoE activity)
MSKWLLTILFIGGIAIGQQNKVIVQKKIIHKNDKEQTVEVMIDGDEMTIVVERDGEKNEYTINIDDKKALKGIKEKLADMDVNIKTMMMDNDNVYSIHSGGYLGVQIQELTDGLRDYFKVKSDDGVLISEVVEDSPAEKAKLKVGDIIVSVNGDGVSTTSELQRAISREGSGADVSLEVIRKGRKKDYTATLGSQKNNFSWTGKMPMMDFGDDDHNVFFFSKDDQDFQLHTKHLKEEVKKLKKSEQKLKKKHKMRMVAPMPDHDVHKDIEELKKEIEALRKEIQKLKKS